MENKVDDIDELVLNEANIIESRDIFRTNIFTGNFHIVSQLLKEKLEAQGVEGVVLVDNSSTSLEPI